MKPTREDQSSHLFLSFKLLNYASVTAAANVSCQQRDDKYEI